MIIYLTLILLIPFQTHPILSVDIFGLSIIKIVGIIAVLVALIDSHNYQSAVIKIFNKQQSMFVLMNILIIMSVAMYNENNKIAVLQTYIAFIVFNIVTTLMIHSHKRMTHTMQALVAALFISSLYIIKEYIINAKVYGIAYRPFGGTYGDPNYYAQSAIMVMPIIYYLIKISSNFLMRSTLYMMFTVLGVSVVLSNSRGAFIGISAMLIMLLVLSNNRFKVASALLFTTLIVCLMLPNRVYDRFNNIQIVEDEATATGDIASTNRRLTLAFAALDMVKAHPLLGVGVGNFKEKSIIYRPSLKWSGIAHNTYLEFAAEAGLPAFLLFMGILAATFSDLFHIRKLTEQIDNNMCILSSCLILSLTGYSITALFLSGQNKIFWLIIFLTMAIKRIAYAAIKGMQHEKIRSL